MRLRTLTLALILTLMPAAAWGNPFEFDLAGLKLGMSAEEARAVVEKKEQAYQFDEFKKDGRITGFNARVPHPRMSRETVDSILVLVNEDTGVWLIGRSQDYLDGSRPTVAAFIESLEKKYCQKWNGKPNPRYNHSWAFDREGRYLAGQEARKCLSLHNAGGQRVAAAAGGLALPASFDPECGVCITTNFRADGDMVQSYSVKMVDGKSMYDLTRAKADAAEQESREKLEREKQQSVTPDI